MPKFSSPPPAPAEPPVMVRPEIVAVTFGAPDDPMAKTSTPWPPLTVTPAAGPVIVVVPVALLSSSVAPGVIVCPPVNTAGSKLISESAY